MKGVSKFFSWLFSSKKREEAKRKAEIIKQAAISVLAEGEEDNNVRPFVGPS